MGGTEHCTASRLKTKLWSPYTLFRGAVKRLVLNGQSAKAYWKIAPHVHRYRRYLSPKYVNPPLDPFKIVHVDPDAIVRFTGREYPTWRNRWQLFGARLAGDWDQRMDIPIASTYNGPEPSLYHADQFTETPLYQSMEAHFVDGKPWRETAFVQEVLNRASDDQYDGPVWHRCTTPSEVRDRCRFLDRLYESLRRRGCLSMRELNAERGYPLTFSEVMENEILVDVGRDGELLFVTGRHRLAIAKLLDLDTIPVVPLVRHRQWNWLQEYCSPLTDSSLSVQGSD